MPVYNDLTDDIVDIWLLESASITVASPDISHDKHQSKINAGRNASIAVFSAVVAFAAFFVVRHTLLKNQSKHTKMDSSCDDRSNSTDPTEVTNNP